MKQMRVRVSAGEAKVLQQYFDAMRFAEANFKNAETNLLAASSMVLARKKIQQALVDDIDGDELWLTIPDVPAELLDVDRQFPEKTLDGKQ